MIKNIQQILNEREKHRCRTESGVFLCYSSNMKFCHFKQKGFVAVEMGRWVALWWISISELFALSLWFSATAIVPELKQVWHLSTAMEAWVTSSVQIGFIAGALFSSYFGISDRYDTRKIFSLAALGGAILNGFLIFTDNALAAISLRFLTGVMLTGIYPTAVKLLSQWFPNRRGMAIGILIAALSLGSSLPHFVVLFISSVNWRLVIVTSSILAFLASLIMKRILVDAPASSNRNSVSFRMLKKVISNKPVMLANYGYFGHMWELYAMWTWLPAFLTASCLKSSPTVSPLLGALFSFISIGVAGAFGCVIGGYYSDKIGRSRLTIIAMSVSAFCSLLIGFTFGHSIWLTFILALIWGMSIIADSAQFSAVVTEFAEVEYVGTALTFQMSIGFLITIFSINMIPLLETTMGWEWVFTLLSIGPILGTIAMSRLKYFEVRKEKTSAIWDYSMNDSNS
jgi:MFS family permease